MTDKNEKNVASFFVNPEASSAVVLAAPQIAAPIVRGAALTVSELMMGGGIRVVYFLFDKSPSMDPVAQLLRDAFNNDFVPAVKEARESDVSTLRIGGAAFSGSAPEPIWKGKDTSGNVIYFHPLDELPPLTIAEYDPSVGNSTALHLAIELGTARAVRYAADVQKETGTDVELDIMILSDGGNNVPPYSPAKAAMLIESRDRTRVRYVYFYFETDQGLKDPRSYAINDLKIDVENVETFMRKPNETEEELHKRFRRMMAVLSKVSGARNVSAVVASAAVPEDEEII